MDQPFDNGQPIIETLKELFRNAALDDAAPRQTTSPAHLTYVSNLALDLVSQFKRETTITFEDRTFISGMHDYLGLCLKAAAPGTETGERKETFDCVFRAWEKSGELKRSLTPS